MKKKLILIALALLVSVILLVLTPKPEQVTSPVGPEVIQVVLPTGLAILADVADEPREWEQGLSGRESLDVTEGMLFVWPEPVIVGMWMKDMNFPIDMIFMNELGEVVYVVQDAQPDDSEDREVYRADVPVTYILEASAGIIESQGVEIGNVLEMIY